MSRPSTKDSIILQLTMENHRLNQEISRLSTELSSMHIRDAARKDRLSLNSIGKRVSHLINRSKRFRKLTSAQQELLRGWIQDFNGEVPKRFSSRLYSNLEYIRTCYKLEPRVKEQIDWFLSSHPELSRQV